jgi:hypothetical protein
MTLWMKRSVFKIWIKFLALWLIFINDIMDEKECVWSLEKILNILIKLKHKINVEARFELTFSEYESDELSFTLFLTKNTKKLIVYK